MSDVLIGMTLQPLDADAPPTLESVLAGFDRLREETPLNSVEIWMAPEHRPRAHVFWPEDYTAERRRAMKAFLARFDYCGVHLPFLFNNYIAPNPAVAEPALRQLELGVEIAGELGCRYAVMHAEWDNRGFVKEDDNFRRYAAAFGRLCGRARAAGLRLCAETCFFIGDRHRAARMVREVDNAEFGITLDAGKAMRNNGFSNEAVLELIEEIGPAMGSTHLYDYPSREETARILPGCGMVDVPAIVARLWRTGYRGVFSLETSGTYGPQKRAVEALAAYVDAART